MKAEEKALLFCEFRVTFVVILTDFNDNFSEFNEPAEPFCVNITEHMLFAMLREKLQYKSIYFNTNNVFASYYRGEHIWISLIVALTGLLISSPDSDNILI